MMGAMAGECSGPPSELDSDGKGANVGGARGKTALTARPEASLFVAGFARSHLVRNDDEKRRNRSQKQ